MLNQFKHPKYLLWISLFFFLTACGPSEPAIGTPAGNSPVQNTSVSEQGYPSSVEEQGYPGQTISFESSPTQAGYPPAGQQSPTPLPLPRFQFETILQAGQTEIIGQAPPNLSLAILDITFNGVILGVGGSDGNGQFQIAVSPLTEGHRVGITIGELTPGKTMEEMSTELYPYRGDNFMNVPNLGIFFETGLVQP